MKTNYEMVEWFDGWFLMDNNNIILGPYETRLSCKNASYCFFYGGSLSEVQYGNKFSFSSSRNNRLH